MRVCPTHLYILLHSSQPLKLVHFGLEIPISNSGSYSNEQTLLIEQYPSSFLKCRVELVKYHWRSRKSSESLQQLISIFGFCKNPAACKESHPFCKLSSESASVPREGFDER